MHIEKLAAEISAKDADIEAFTDGVLRDGQLREAVLDLLFSRSEIMIYYHCYYIIDAASGRMPGLFYDRFDEFAALLDHKNSYHRDIGLSVIANLSAADTGGKTAELLGRYAGHLRDSKFMTAQCCVRGLGRIAAQRPELAPRIAGLLTGAGLPSDDCPYTEKQLALLGAGIIEAFEPLFPGSGFDAELTAFAEARLKSISPKARKAAAAFLKRAAAG